jgi:thiol-disulfide isomerase/thioredoxin
LQVRKLLIALITIPLLLACSSPNSTGTGDETSFVAGDGTMTLVPQVDRENPVELAGQTLTGEQLDIATYRGKVVVVNVWASWCAPCRAEAGELANLAKEFSNESVQFIGLNTRDSLSAAIAFNERFQTGFPSLQDKEGELTLAFGKLGPAATPTTIVLDKAGRPAGRILGPVTEAQLRSLIKAVLEEV